MSYSVKSSMDVFEEILQYDLYKMTDVRRFSFSVPADLVGKSNFDPLYDGCGYCGECADCLEDSSAFILKDDIAEYNNTLSTEDVEDIMSPPSYTTIVASDPISKMIAEGNYNTQFKIPPYGAKDARCIWLDADLDDIEPFKEIEMKLYTWASKFAELESKGGETYITWKTVSNCKCVSTWHNFLRWILCACLSGTSGGAS